MSFYTRPGVQHLVHAHVGSSAASVTVGKRLVAHVNHLADKILCCIGGIALAIHPQKQKRVTSREMQEAVRVFIGPGVLRTRCDNGLIKAVMSFVEHKMTTLPSTHVTHAAVKHGLAHLAARDKRFTFTPGARVALAAVLDCILGEVLRVACKEACPPTVTALRSAVHRDPELRLALEVAWCVQE